jgi:hypothetical protein
LTAGFFPIAFLGDGMIKRHTTTRKEFFEMIFDTEFFPTPAEVIDRMLAPFATDKGFGIRLGSRRILDPSAGTGSILEHIQNKYDSTGRYGMLSKYYAIEIEPELRAVLKEKGFNPIAFDFLTFEPDQFIDLIVMNPPFSEGVDHLLHAWDILPHGDIACLLNVETIRNPYTKKRKILIDLIHQYGGYEVFGPCFAEAERPTDVEVVCVWLKKPEKESTFNFSKDQFDFERKNTASIEYENNSELAHPGIIDALIAQYQAARYALINTHRAKAKYDFYTRNIGSRYKENNSRGSEQSISREAVSIAQEIDKLRAGFWSHVFTKTKVMNHTTSNFHKKVEQLQEESNGLTFNKENIFALLEHFLQHSGQIMEDCICDVFDEMTAFHEKNKVWVEGWKTNSAYKVNRKIIIPDRGTFFNSWGSWRYNQYDNKRLWATLGDLDKMLCWVMELAHDEVVFANDAIDTHCKDVDNGDIEYTDKFYSTFFELRIYKKGTIHIKFRDVTTWENFNRKVATIRKWIAPAEPAEAKPEPTPTPAAHQEEPADQMGLMLV